MTQEVLRRVATLHNLWSRCDYLKVMKEKYLLLIVCKYCDSHSNKFGIGLDIFKFERMEGDTLIFADKAIKPPLGEIAWNDSVYQWSYTQWALFLLLICKLTALKNIITFIPSYKFLRIPSENRIRNFCQNIQKKLNQLKKKKEFKNICMHNQLNVNIDIDVYNDIVLYFDTDPHNIWYPFCRGLGFPNISKTQRLKPAVTHCPPCGNIAVDYFGKRYKSRKSYVMQRILRGTDGNISELDIMNAKYIYGTLKISRSAKRINCTMIQKQNKARKLAIRIGFLNISVRVCVPLECLKHCEICQVVLRTHAIYVTEYVCRKYNVKFVNKLWICKCRNLMVCGKKCYKVAWSRKGHRDICGSRIEH
eukprot:120073_1